MTVAIDLSGIMPTDTAVMEVLKPGGVEGTGWKITFAGPGHPKAIAWSDENARKSLRTQKAQEAARVNGRKWKPEDRTEDEQRRENARWVVSHIVDWTPVSVGNGPIPFTEGEAIALLMRPEMAWAFLQMIDFLNDDRSFTKRSETTSEHSPSANSSSDSASPKAEPTAST